MSASTESGMKRARTGLPAFLRAPEWGLVVGIGAVLGVIYLLNTTGSFFQPRNRVNLVHNIALFGVLSLGAAVVIIAGGIDLSVGSVVALCGVVGARLTTEWLPGASAGAEVPPAVIAGAVALTLLLGLAIGLFHALLICVLRLPPFIATLATMAGLRSAARLACGDRSINVNAETFQMLGRDNIYTVSIFAIAAVAMSVMMGATVLGRHLYALGGNEAAARLSGLPVGRLKSAAYGISGMLSALGGILFTGNTGQAQGTMGVSYELFAITAAVVGGCSLAGGVGSIKGTVLGLVLIQFVINGTGLTITWIDSTQIEGLVLGTVVVLAVAFNQRFRRRG